MSDSDRQPLLIPLYGRYLRDGKSADYIAGAAARYTLGTLQRLARSGSRTTRRAAILALGFLGGSESLETMGLALCDDDRGVRLLAERFSRNVWYRASGPAASAWLRVIARTMDTRAFQNVLRQARMLIRSCPQCFEAWNQRAIALYQLGRYEEAVYACHRTLKLNPFHFVAATHLGRCYLELGHPHAAVASFRRALEIHPGLETVRSKVRQLERALRDQS